MNILVVSQYYYPEPFRVHEICEKLQSDGNEVVVFTSFPNYPEGRIYPEYKKKKTLKEETINGVDVHRIKSTPRGKTKIGLAISYLSFWHKGKRKVKALLKSQKFDVVYSYGLSPVTQTFPAIKAARICKAPLFLYCLDLWPESFRDYFPYEKSLAFRLIKRLSIKAYNSCARIGVTSKSFITYLHSVCNVPENKLFCLPQHADDVSKQGNISTVDNDCIDIVFTGNVGGAQNMDQIVDAVEMLSDLGGFKVHIVGAGSELEHIKRRVKEEQLENKIILYGKRPYSEMIDYYRLADACLLTLSNKTSTGLTIPGKLQGYMAAGKPIIASINGDAADVINEAKCGICVPADDAKALAGAIRSFVNSPNEYSECGINARKYYLEHYTLAKHVEALTKELRALVKENESTDD